MKYKVGDKVQVINELFLPERWNGTIGIITKILNDMYFLDGLGYYPFTDDEIELYKNKKQKIKLP